MKQILSAAAVALAFAVSASAQATPQSQSQSQPQPSPSSATQKSAKTHKKTSSTTQVTLTGCLRQGDTPDSFELDNVQMSSSDMSSMHGEQHGTATAPGTTNPSAAAGSGTSPGMSGGMSGNEMGPVKLLANADIDLKDHVGHRVEVRGTMSGQAHGSSPSGSMGSGASASPSPATGTSGTSKEISDKNAHALRVRSFRHISDTCSQ